MRHSYVVVLVVFASLLVAIAAVTLWVDVDVLNAERFAAKVTSAFESEAVRETIAGAVVDRVLEDRPLAARMVRDRVVEFLAPLMAHPTFMDVVNRTVTGAHDLLLTETQRPLLLDFGSLEPLITALVRLVNPEMADEVSATMTQMEEGITLFTEGELPQIHRLAGMVPWLWPLSILGAVGLFVIAVMKAADKRRAVSWIGYGLFATGGLLLLFIPAVQSTIVNGIARPGARALASEALTILLRDLQLLSLVIAGSGGVAWLASRGVQRTEATAAAAATVATAG